MSQEFLCEAEGHACLEVLLMDHDDIVIIIIVTTRVKGFVRFLSRTEPP